MRRMQRFGGEIEGRGRYKMQEGTLTEAQGIGEEPKTQM